MACCGEDCRSSSSKIKCRRSGSALPVIASRLPASVRNRRCCDIPRSAAGTAFCRRRPPELSLRADFAWLQPAPARPSSDPADNPCSGKAPELPKTQPQTPQQEIFSSTPSKKLRHTATKAFDLVAIADPQQKRITLVG